MEDITILWVKQTYLFKITSELKSRFMKWYHQTNFKNSWKCLFITLIFENILLDITLFLLDTYLFFWMFIHSTGQSEIVLQDKNTFQLDVSIVPIVKCLVINNATISFRMRSIKLIIYNRMTHCTWKKNTYYQYVLWCSFYLF